MSGAGTVGVSHALGSWIHARDGRRMVDLVNGFGSVFLGHRHPAVVARVNAALNEVWACGRHATPALAEANARIAGLLPGTLAPAGLYSTGMEVAEFAIRIAVRHTGRREIVGFARSMHGKSVMSASMCWDNAPLRPREAAILPFVADAPEAEILERLRERLRRRATAAVFVEPIQGSNGAHEASPAFYDAVVAACRESDTLCVIDEILTGLYRTGTRFYVDRLAAPPDVLLFAKAMGNGFPVSSIAVRRELPIDAGAMPGSTFSDHPLAGAAAAAVLGVMQETPIAERVRDVEHTVRDRFGALEGEGMTLRGRGTLWALELAGSRPLAPLQEAIGRAGVLVSAHGRHIRLLPGAMIEPDVLAEACDRILECCRAAGR